MKKLITIPVIALLTLAGVFTLGQQSRSARAAGTTPAQQGISQTQKQVNTDIGKPDVNETGLEIKGKEASWQKGTEADAPGGHQDAQGTNVDHQFNGAE
ncbi:hypothetical protein M1615_01655 [Patescibacteria group bacterium]|nr:hypothetical protein [Patescibacteria group bacterium]